MATNEYNFQYVPLNGKLPGEVMVQQTQDAINDLCNRVIRGAEADAAEAVEKADNAVNASSEAVETANNAETTAQEALDYITGDFPKVHFVGVNSNATSDANYTGGGATGTDAIAIGVTASATNTNSVAIGTGSVASGANEVSVGNDNTKRKIVNVQEGSSNNDVMTYGQGVDRTSAQTISGVKTFSAVPAISGAISADDNSMKIATTAWVNQRIGTGVVASGNTGLINGDTAYAELRPTKDGTWVKGANTTAQNLEALEGGLEYSYAILSRQYDALKKYVNGNYYDYDTDDDEAYTKTVPQGAMPYASLDKVGGKTVVMNQLITNGNFPDTTGWSDASSNPYVSLTAENGKLIVKSTASSTRGWRVKTSASIIAGHKYLIRGYCQRDTDIVDGDADSITVNFGGIESETVATIPTPISTVGVGQKLDTILTPTKDNTEMIIGFWGAVSSRTGTNNMFTIWDINLYDLTLMFGAGNEPTTVAEFEAMFPASYYAYDAGTLLSAGVTSVVSKDSTDTEIASYPIPAAVQALTGYGWSCPSHYNYIDYEAKKFVQEVGSRAYASGDESDATVITDGTTTYYALSPAVETDISSYLTDDNLIEVEAGGTLTFPNSNGTDYQIPVPSGETYMIDLSV